MFTLEHLSRYLFVYLERKKYSLFRRVVNFYFYFTEEERRMSFETSELNFIYPEEEIQLSSVHN